MIILLRSALVVCVIALYAVAGGAMVATAGEAKQHNAEHAATILVLGDSISAAYGMSLEQGWVAQLQQQLTNEAWAVTVVNASISGETSAGGLRRLPALLEKHKPKLVIVELGGNDGLRGFPLKIFKKNLTQIVSLSHDVGASTLLLPMEIPPNYGVQYTQGFRNTFVDVAKESGALLGPFILDGIATNPSLMQADGIHPTTKAQPAMLANVYAAVLQALEQQ